MCQGLYIVGCSRNENKKPEVNVIPVTGNPLSFIENTVKNQNFGLEPELFDEEDTEWEISFQVIETQHQQQIKTLKEAEEDQQPVGKTDDEVINTDNLRFISKKSSENSIALVSKSNIEYVNIILKENNLGNFVINFENTEQHAYGRERRLGLLDATVEHYSTKEDFSVFNILLSYENDQKDEGVLIEMTFVKVIEPSVAKEALDSTYEYLFAAGKNVSWDQQKALEIKICESGHASLFINKIKKAFALWSEVLENRLDLRTSNKTELCPPFSDLNTQTIRHVQGWIKVQGPIGTVASVLSEQNPFKASLYDSDMFVFEDEWTESTENNYNMSQQLFRQGPIALYYEFTIVHELGHMLGLHHKFDGTDSVMSYNDLVPKLHSYDIAAIQALYPLKGVTDSNTASATTGP